MAIPVKSNIKGSVLSKWTVPMRGTTRRHALIYIYKPNNYFLKPYAPLL